MNAKKIMGAVLVALLAAALFIGAGAASTTADPTADGKTVFVYQPVGAEFKGTWANGANTVTFEAVKHDGDNKYAIIGTDIVEGTYVKGEESIIVKYPTAVITGIAGPNGAKYSFIGGNLYESDVNTAGFTNATGVDGITAIGYAITGSDGIPLVYSTPSQFEGAGEYKIQALFNATDFVEGMPANYIYGAVYTFTVVDDDEATVVADVDTILLGDKIKLTVTAKPGSYVKLDGDDFEVVGGQVLTYDASKEYIIVPNTGKLTFAITTKNAETGDETIVVKVGPQNDLEEYEVDITIEKGTITASAELASYFVGDEVTIIGTSTAGKVEYYSIKGTNFEYGPVAIPDDEDKDANGFEFVINTATISNEKDGFKGNQMDVGTYTLTLLVGADKNKPTAKATVAVVLKQPFISIIEAPEVIVQGDEAEFIINAEATEGIRYYIFGTNYFNASDIVDTNVKDNENQFKFTLTDTFTEDMDAGQYFMVIQHPMYDEAFNIIAVEDVFYLNTSGTPVVLDAKTSKLFNVDKRQTANAAQALCDALDTQNIDDMYVKYSFFVVGEDESFTISEIPATIAQGETLTISGVSTANAGEYVTVEMISTAFAAVPKETVGSAAFIAVTTQIADDGTWEVTFDTSNLNVDEYSLSVACTGEDKPWKNVEINVVEAADKPDTPVTPPADDEPGQDEPVAPETPGFGALAALAGLGAVAVLLLRRE